MKSDAEAKNISEIIKRHIQKEEAEKEGTQTNQEFSIDQKTPSANLENNGLNEKDNCEIDDAEIDEIIN